MKALFILSSVLIFSCSTVKKSEKPADLDQPEDSAAPEWVYAPDEACPDSEICATGEGESLQQADSRARKSLASVFGTKIQSQLDIHKTDYSDEEVSEIKEFVNSQISESVDGILKGVEIKKRYERDKLFFALAVLDKSKASESLEHEIEAIDSELSHLYSLKRKSSIKRMMTLLDMRASLSDKLIVINGKASASPVSFAQVQNIKFSSGGYNKVRIKTGNSVPVVFSKFLEENLTSSGYQVLDSSAVDYVIDLKYQAKEAYLNVEGFKKFVFTFSAQAYNNVNEKVGSFTINHVENGRSERDAFLKAKRVVQKEIEEKFNLLNLK